MTEERRRPLGDDPDQSAELERVAHNEIADKLRRLAAAEEAKLLQEQADAAERARMLDEGGRNDDE